jgi:hypothetical protein
MRFYFFDPPPRADGPRFHGQPVCPDVYTPPPGVTSRPDLLAVAILDLWDRTAVDPTFVQLAELVREAEQQAAPKCEAVMYSFLAFGAEPSDRRAEATHAAYNRLWADHPELWETIRGRALPICLWLVDRLGRPFHGIVQPALNGDFEVWMSSDVRTTEIHELYAGQGGAWSAMLLPLGADVSRQAQAHLESVRADKGTAEEQAGS